MQDVWPIKKWKVFTKVEMLGIFSQAIWWHISCWSIFPAFLFSSVPPLDVLKNRRSAYNEPLEILVFLETALDWHILNYFECWLFLVEASWFRHKPLLLCARRRIFDSGRSAAWHYARSPALRVGRYQASTREPSGSSSAAKHHIRPPNRRHHSLNTQFKPNSPAYTIN